MAPGRQPAQCPTLRDPAGGEPAICIFAAGRPAARGLAAGLLSVGGLSIGLLFALGGAAFGPSIIDGRRCDPAAAAFVREWLSAALLPPRCR